MPNIYESGKHDLVGSIVGIVDKHEIINGKKNVKSGDLMVAFDSGGPHTNGFSLIRKIYNENKSKFTSEMIETLAKPHRCYLKEYIKICEEDIDIFMEWLILLVVDYSKIFVALCQIILSLIL